MNRVELELKLKELAVNPFLFLENVVDYMDKNEIEPEAIGNIIKSNDHLLEVMKISAITLNYIKGESSNSLFEALF